MPAPTPVLTAEERAAALEKAREARHARAQFKQALKSGEKTFEDAFALQKDEAIGRIKVTELLQTLPQIGENKTAAIIEEIGIASSRRLKGLGQRQIKALLEVEKKCRG